MTTNATADERTVHTKVKMLADVLAAQVDEHGMLPEDNRFEITVSYENRNGDISLRSGTVWAFDEGEWNDKIRVSESAGEDSEDPYYIRVRDDRSELVSVAETREVDLGDVSNIVVED